MADTPIAPEPVLASDASVLVPFGREPSPEASDLVLRATALLRSSPPFRVIDLQPAYTSVLVRFDPLSIPPAEALARVRDALAALPGVVLPRPRVVDVPVLYGGEEGPDLGEVARRAGLAERDAAELHAAGEYRVAFVGFTPGFPYLLGLDRRLATPRLATPRRRVPAGSVAIGGAQAGIYPRESPGGWRIVGRTPLRLFDPGREPAALLRIGDRVRFVPARGESRGVP